MAKRMAATGTITVVRDWAATEALPAGRWEMRVYPGMPSDQWSVFQRTASFEYFKDAGWVQTWAWIENGIYLEPYAEHILDLIDNLMARGDLDQAKLWIVMHVEEQAARPSRTGMIAAIAGAVVLTALGIGAAFVIGAR